MQGYRLCEINWAEENTSITLCPGPGEARPSLGPGHYLLKVVVVAQDAAPIETEYEVDTRRGGHVWTKEVKGNPIKARTELYIGTDGRPYPIPAWAIRNPSGRPKGIVSMASATLR